LALLLSAQGVVEPRLHALRGELVTLELLLLLVLDVLVEHVLALLLAQQLGYEERLPHEHLAVHILESLQGLFRLFVAHKSVPSVHLLLLVALGHRVHLDLDGGHVSELLEGIAQHGFVHALVDELDLKRLLAVLVVTRDLALLQL